MTSTNRLDKIHRRTLAWAGMFREEEQRDRTSYPNVRTHMCAISYWIESINIFFFITPDVRRARYLPSIKWLWPRLPIRSQKTFVIIYLAWHWPHQRRNWTVINKMACIQIRNKSSIVSPTNAVTTYIKHSRPNIRPKKSWARNARTQRSKWPICSYALAMPLLCNTHFCNRNWFLAESHCPFPPIRNESTHHGATHTKTVDGKLSAEPAAWISRTTWNEFGGKRLPIALSATCPTICPDPRPNLLTMKRKINYTEFVWPGSNKKRFMLRNTGCD